MDLKISRCQPVSLLCSCDCPYSAAAKITAVSPTKPASTGDPGIRYDFGDRMLCALT